MGYGIIDITGERFGRLVVDSFAYTKNNRAYWNCTCIGLKTCVYSGSSDISKFKDALPYLDWLKLGRYEERLKSINHIEHGVKLATSNQHLYKIVSKDGKIMI